jgi:hypothetical protein
VPRERSQQDTRGGGERGDVSWVILHSLQGFFPRQRV